MRARSPLHDVERLYSTAVSAQQRRACLRYLLQYQHFNAEYTIDECKQLGYPQPLFAPLKHHSYARTDYLPFVQLASKWIAAKLNPFFQPPFSSGLTAKKVRDKVKITTTNAASVLATFYQQKYSIKPLTQFDQNDTNQDIVYEVQLDIRADLNRPVHEVVNEIIRQTDPNATIRDLRGKQLLFSSCIPGIDCAVVFCGEVIEKKNQIEVRFKKLESVFSEMVFTLLNKCGASSDRIALNQMMTHEIDVQNITFDQAVKQLGIDKYDSKDDPADVHFVDQWTHGLAQFASTQFSDNDSQLQQNAILRWQQVFFAQHKETLQFAAPLLCSQVLPWLAAQASLPDLIKAYQNLCEIVMLCLDAFPAIGQQTQFHTKLQSTLDSRQHLAGLTVRTGLYDYAMEAMFDSLQHCLQHDQHVAQNREANIVCIGQNYFETSSMLEDEKFPASVTTKDKLSDVRELPDILVTDIHPNNAAKPILFENNVSQWVQTELTKYPNKHLTLILDITLNNYHDDDFQDLLKTLKPFISNGQLDIFGVQSLAKLIQHGADNFSGGAGFYIGNGAFHTPTLPQGLETKSAFYGTLLESFSDIAGRYYQLVRTNSEHMYNELRRKFEKIKRACYSQTQLWIDAVEKTQTQFCATDVSLNVDDSAVYVTLNFRDFFERMNITDPKEKEKLAKKIQDLLIKLSNQRGCSLTARQSFGFSMSNMSVVLDNIRFSIGTENLETLDEYAQIINDVSYALTKFASTDNAWTVVADRNWNRFADSEFTWDAFEPEFNWDTLEEKVVSIYHDLFERKEARSVVRAPMYANEDYFDDPEEIGDCELLIGNNTLTTIRTTNTKGSPTRKRRTNSKLTSQKSDDQWTYEEVFQLLAHIELVNPNDIYVTKNQIKGFQERGYLFRDREELVDSASGVRIVKNPSLQVILPDGTRYEADQIYVQIKEFDSQLTKVKKLDDSYLHQVLFDCVHHEFSATDADHKPGSIILQLGKRKRSISYEKMMISLYKNRGLQGVVNYLNKLDLDKLPLFHQQTYHQHSKRPIDRLTNMLMALGAHLVDRFRNEHIALIQKIEDERCRNAIVKGIFQQLFEMSPQEMQSLRKSSAIALVSLFSSRQFLKCIDDYRIEQWISDMVDFYKINPPEQAYDNYLTSMMPIIKYCYRSPGSLCDTQHSISLYKMAQAAHFQPLTEHVDSLAANIANSMRTHSKTCSLKAFFDLYCRYPLTDLQRSDIEQAVSTFDKEKLYRWIQRPYDFHATFDACDLYFNIPTPDDVIIGDEHHPSAEQFFVSSGCRQILLKRLRSKNTESDDINCALRWGIICDDVTLIDAAILVLKRLGLCDKTFRQLQNLIGHLKPYNNIFAIAKECEFVMGSQSFEQFLSVFSDNALLSSRVRNGLFTGHLPRSMREIKGVMDDIYALKYPLNESLAKLVAKTKCLGPNHPVAMQARKARNEYLAKFHRSYSEHRGYTI